MRCLERRLAVGWGNLGDNLGGHVAGSTAEYVQLAGFGDLDGEAEVDEFNYVLVGEEDVVHFDVAVCDVLLVEVLHGLGDLVGDGEGVLGGDLLVGLLLDVGGQGDGFDAFHY